MLREPRFALDVAPLRGETTGVGVYIAKIVAEVGQRAPGQLALLGVRPGGPFADVPAVARTTLDGGRYLPWLLRHADRDARRLCADLVHYPIAVAPLRTRVPYVVTIHDLSTLRHPRHHPPLRVARLLLIAPAAHRARAVLVPSRSTGRDVVRAFGVPARRVITIVHANDRVIEPGARPGDRAILERHGVEPGGYVFATGGLDGRKNPVRLAHAMGRLPVELAALRLVIAGPMGWRADEMRREIETSAAAHRIRLAGFVTDEELEALLRNAAVSAFVSLHEGFGLPVLEGMAAGVPVVTSRVSAMPEVAGGAAVLVDPRDIDAIARGITEALRRRKELVPAGLARAASRTWGDFADELLDIYRWAARRP